ncbi:Gfo/Idh/MocA family protein [Leucobacter massiliensis]|uniref:Oxidoreductase n=1 Tax=Leucobacter massiliensis TaxID=1686285 RepID=A0A2S9QL21_9MICO|nr:Gfo/Idh/MocA family oxidoreductase [Leucobacter massiliensis]PRI10280.1 hypothetical protein B4915_12870 [Leucobacter massiliensis]
MTVRAALVGLGFAAQELKLPGYLAARDLVEIVAVADPDPHARAVIAQQLGLPPEACHEGYEELLARADVDYIDVSTPHLTHLPILALAAERGVSVICDKPLAMSVAEVDEMIGLVERSGIRAGVHHNYAHFPSHAEMLRQIGAGAIGRVDTVTMSAHSVYAPGVMPGEDGWRGVARLAGGGILMDYGIHLLYLSLRLLGPGFIPRTVTARVDKRRIRADADVEDTVTVHIEGERGETAALTLTWGTGTSGHTVVDGETGTLQIRYPDGFSAQHNVAHELQIMRGRLGDPESIPVEWERLPLEWYYGGSIRSFAEYVRGGEPSGVATLDEARATISLALSAYESVALDRPVEVPLSPASPLYSLGVTGVHRMELASDNVIRRRGLYRPASDEGAHE